MDGGDGDDIFIIEGMGSYRDSIQGGSGFDQILGGTGHDQMGFTRFDATNSIELIDGGAGVNTIVGSYQSETFDFSASTLVNIDAIYGEGGNDILIGSQGNDTLDGGTWHDILEGGNGDDILIGGGGSDVFRAGIGIDTLRSHKASLSEKDTLEIMGGHAINDLWFTQTGNDLDIFILGTQSQIKIENWYTSDYEKVDVIKNNGYQMHKHSVEALVNAMAGFGAPSGGTISLSASEQMQMSDAIAAAWQ